MPRVDAQRNIDALLAAAKAEFAEQGVDVNVRAIAARAGVGTATLYRHFPLRSDLIRSDQAGFRCRAAFWRSGVHRPEDVLR